MPPIALAALLALAAAPYPADRAAKWEKEVAAVEKRVTANPPADPVVFAGSSTIRLWDVATSFPGRPVVNVGFGGAEARDCTHFAPRLVVPLRPRVVVFYAGDNDLAAGRSPEQVRDDFVGFVAAVRASAPSARIVFVSVKPSPSRWHLLAAQKRANELVKGVLAADPRLGYADVTAGLIGPDGRPDPVFYVKDGLHLSPKGYEVMTAAVQKALDEK